MKYLEFCNKSDIYNILSKDAQIYYDVFYMQRHLDGTTKIQSIKELARFATDTTDGTYLSFVGGMPREVYGGMTVAHLCDTLRFFADNELPVVNHSYVSDVVIDDSDLVILVCAFDEKGNYITKLNDKLIGIRHYFERDRTVVAVSRYVGFTDALSPYSIYSVLFDLNGDCIYSKVKPGLFDDKEMKQLSEFVRNNTELFRKSSPRIECGGREYEGI